MSLFNDIAGQIKNILLNDVKFSGFIFLNASSSKVMPNPVNKVYITVGMKDININEGSFSRYLGFNNGNELYGKLVESNVALSVYVPQTFNGEKCYDIFSDIYESLLTSESSLNIKSISCGRVTYVDELFSFVLECSVNISAFVGYETDELEINSIKVIKG